MIRFAKFLKLKSVRSRLLIYIYLDILILSVFLGFFAYRTARNLTITDIGMSQKQFVKETTRMISQEFNELQSKVEIILYDKGLTEVLNGDLIKQINQKKYQVDKQIQMQISPAMRENGLIGALVIVDKDDGMMSYTGSFSRIEFREDLEDHIRAREWFSKMMSEQTRVSLYC